MLSSSNNGVSLPFHAHTALSRSMSRQRRETASRSSSPRRRLPTNTSSFSSRPATESASTSAIIRNVQHRAGRQPPPAHPGRSRYVEPSSRHYLGRMDIECPFCHALHWKDEQLTTSTRTCRKFGTCCLSGQVKLDLLQNPPLPLRLLFDGRDAQSKDFHENIWRYNRAFAFTSLGVNQDHDVNAHRRGPPVFRIQGELYHRSGSLLPAPANSPAYSQIYIYDPAEALAHRQHNNPALRLDTMTTLQNCLLQSHPYSQIYKSAYDFLSTYPPTEEWSILLRVAPGSNINTHNMPSARNIAVIMPGDVAEGDCRDIVLHTRQGPLQRISEGHSAYAPLQYPIFFPWGESGWHWEMTLHQPESQHPKRLSLTRWAAYRIHERSNEYSLLLRGGRLYERFLVDMFAAADQQRLTWLRHNQGTLRASLYSGIEDAIDGDENVDLHNLGWRTVLPSSYVGGPRYMQQKLQDSLALARFYHHIDLFITITGNPQWIEIVEALRPGETSYDRPDLVARVFELKRKAIMKDIMDNHIFGEAVAEVDVLEFQKRNIPHSHVLVINAEGSRYTSPADIDSTICAEWPDPDTQPLLFQTVKSTMIHGPCGAANPLSPCMKDGKCTKGYPKPFRPITVMDDNGYPQYRRRNDGRSYRVGNHDVSNQWIVPYNPFLSAKYNCHINVECAASMATFKYMFKYLHKGADRISMAVQKNDEISRYLIGRWVGGPEATCRILHFSTHHQIPHTTVLPVHLPGQHLVTFDPNEDQQSILARAANEKTRLTEFFKANLTNVGGIARSKTYQEFPQFFVWKNKQWSLRKRDFAIGRMVFVPPTCGERFYLRTLLATVKGPTSWEDLRTDQGVTHDTFHDVCVSRGLLEDDNEWRQCLQDAVDMQPGGQLRHLFAVLLIHCNPSQPDILWNEFRNHICDDVCYKMRILGFQNPSPDDVYDYGLHLLELILNAGGHSLAEWPSMPRPTQDWRHRFVNPLIAQQLDYTPADELAAADERIPQLNADQRHAFDTIIQAVENPASDCHTVYFLHGPAGTGKTFVYNTICHYGRGHGWVILCVASSGIAALLLQGGRTAHSTFSIPVFTLTDKSYCNIPKESNRADLIRHTCLIIWDEISPQHRFAPEAFDRTCRDLRDNDCPFGGIPVIFGGDFQQTLPIVKHGTKEDTLSAGLQQSYLWPFITVLHLKINMRLMLDDLEDSHAISFSNWLLHVGHGGDMDDDIGIITLPPEIVVHDPSQLINAIYNGISSNPPPPPEYFLHRSILTPRNIHATEINKQILDLMAGEPQTYFSADTVIADPGNTNAPMMPLPLESLQNHNPANLPPSELVLKAGCPLILLRNLAPSQGLCNGTRMIVIRASSRVLEVEIIGNEHHGERVFIPRISLTSSDTDDDIAIHFRRRQFPVRLAFSMTINKAQGQSIKTVGLDLRSGVFAHGQLYVALSRATAYHRMTVLLNHDEQATTNVVYKDVLLD